MGLFRKLLGGAVGLAKTAVVIGTNFFGGGLKGKIMLAVSVATAVTIGLLLWDRSSLNKRIDDANQTIGAHKQTIVNRDAAIESQNGTIRQMRRNEVVQARRHQADIDALLDENAEQQRIAEEARQATANIRKLINENPEVKSWADTPVPAGILECLRRQSGPDNCTSSGTPPS